MLTPRSIEKQIIQGLERGRFHALLRALAANDAPICPPQILNALGRSPSAGLALGLRRLAQLSRIVSEQSIELAQALLRRQQPDGSFEADPLPTAAALAAWHAIDDEPWAWPDELHEQIEHARQRAYRWLAAQQHDSGPFLTSPTDRPAPVDFRGRALASAWILMLLADDESFHRHIDANALETWLTSHNNLLDHHGQMTLAVARTANATGPLVAA